MPGGLDKTGSRPACACPEKTIAGWHSAAGRSILIQKTAFVLVFSVIRCCCSCNCTCHRTIDLYVSMLSIGIGVSIRWKEQGRRAGGAVVAVGIWRGSRGLGGGSVCCRWRDGRALCGGVQRWACLMLRLVGRSVGLLASRGRQVRYARVQLIGLLLSLSVCSSSPSLRTPVAFFAHL